MQVKTFAKAMGVTPDTVRFYSREGLLTPGKNTVNGYHHYGEKERQRLRFITAARSPGFTVADIQRILQVAAIGKTPCPNVRELIQRRPADVEERYQQMLNLRNRMLSAVEDWGTRPDGEPASDSNCPLLERFDS